MEIIYKAFDGTEFETREECKEYEHLHDYKSQKMTSKEALNQLYILADTPEQAIVVQSYYNIVEKDLEFLETIKKYCDIELFYEFAFDKYFLSFTEKAKTKNTFDTPISREDAENFKQSKI